MKERPFPMTSREVLATLAGRKTQTRRLPRPGGFGQPGDRLWVRESHWWFRDERDPATGYFPPPLTIEDVKYRADATAARKGWRAPIHMPRWACRLVLEIVEVRTEPLQAITEADAIAEGIAPDDPDGDFSTPRSRFMSLWDHINGKRAPWANNPEVTVIAFRVLSS